MPMASIAFWRPLPRSVTIAMARMSDGKTSSTSITRMMMLSVRPLVKPAIAPRTAPTRIATLTDTKPTTSEMRVPYTTREKTSRKLLSVPMMCCHLSSGQPSRWMQGGASALAPGSLRSSMVSLGPKGAMKSAKIATNAKNSNTTRPMRAER